MMAGTNDMRPSSARSVCGSYAGKMNRFRINSFEVARFSTVLNTQLRYAGMD